MRISDWSSDVCSSDRKADMTTEVSICSNALLRLGADPINSFDEADNFGSNIERARLCANLWPNVRRQVIRSHPWNCATTRVVLSPDAAAPAFGEIGRASGGERVCQYGWISGVAV